MTKERPVSLVNGWLMFFVNLFILIAGVALFVRGVALGEARAETAALAFCIGGALIFGVGIFFMKGLLTLMPNEACILTLFGSYYGTARDSGLWWTNPLMSKRKVSLRARNLEGGKLKVN